MKAQKDFQDINIDREENILCLCPNCHRKAHYALESEKRTLLQKVYNLREKNLKRANIYISFKDLYKKYYWANTDIDLSFVKNQTQAKQAILIKEMLIQIAKEDKVNLTEEEIKIAADDLIIKYVKNN
jgi:5-methylcytosine-specific restriction protein A